MPACLYLWIGISCDCGACPVGLCSTPAEEDEPAWPIVRQQCVDIWVGRGTWVVMREPGAVRRTGDVCEANPGEDCVEGHRGPRMTISAVSLWEVEPGTWFRWQGYLLCWLGPLEKRDHGRTIRGVCGGRRIEPNDYTFRLGERVTLMNCCTPRDGARCRKRAPRSAPGDSLPF